MRLPLWWCSDPTQILRIYLRENLRTAIIVERTRVTLYMLRCVIIMICKSRFMEVFRLPQDISSVSHLYVYYTYGTEYFTVFSRLWSCRLSVWHRPTKEKFFLYFRLCSAHGCRFESCPDQTYYFFFLFAFFFFLFFLFFFFCFQKKTKRLSKSIN